MEKMIKEAIKEFSESRDYVTTSDLQGMIGARVNKIIRLYPTGNKQLDSTKYFLVFEKIMQGLNDIDYPF